MSEYQECVRSYQRKLAELRRLIVNATLDKFGISHELWNRSSEFYSHNSIYAPQIHAIVTIFPYKHMLIKCDRYNELRKQEMYDIMLRTVQMKEDIFLQMFGQFKSGVLEAKDVPAIYDELHTKMHDEIWAELGIEEEEIFNDFYDHKFPFGSRYCEIRDASWKRLAGKLAAE